MKTLLTLLAATDLLAREFSRRRPAECRACKVTKPFWGPTPGGNAGVWYLKALPPCAHGCHSLVARIWVEIVGTYDIKYSPIMPVHRQRREEKLPSPG